MTIMTSNCPTREQVSDEAINGLLSNVVRALAAQMGLPVIDMRLAELADGDMRGLPTAGVSHKAIAAAGR